MKHCLVYVYIRRLNTLLTLSLNILSVSHNTQTSQIYHSDLKPSDNTTEWR